MQSVSLHMPHIAKASGLELLQPGETLPFYKYGIVKNIGARENEKTIARNLYRVLREFDDEKVDIIYSESFAMQGIGSAIMNRLEKAAGHLRISASAVVKQQRYRRVIFVSNTDSYIGPMAAELLRNKELEQEYVVDCSGLVVLFPEPVNPKAEAIMKSAGMTLEGHVAKQFDSESLQPDTLILTVDESTKKKMISEYENTENVYTLSEFAGEGEEIPDPYGKPLTAYGECFEVLKRLIDQLEEKLNSFAKKEKNNGKSTCNGSPVDRAQNQLYPQRGSWNERISRDDRRDCTVDVL